MTIIDGKQNSEIILNKISSEIKCELQQSIGLKSPRLDIVLVGDDFASLRYVEKKEQAALRVGIRGNIQKLPADATLEMILSLVDSLNSNEDVTGFMIQLPLPDRKMEEKVLERIDPAKDADGLTATNLGRLFQNAKDVAFTAPATAIAVEKLLAIYGFDGRVLKKKNVVVLGASKIVGLPIAGLLINQGATVTVCHEFTQNEKSIAQDADILISATGVAKLVKSDWVKDGAVVIDVGLSKDKVTGEISGDVDFENVAPKCSYISKVFGGVGPMTVASLMLNTFELWKRQIS